MDIFWNIFLPACFQPFYNVFTSDNQYYNHQPLLGKINNPPMQKWDCHLKLCHKNFPLLQDIKLNLYQKIWMLMKTKHLIEFCFHY